MCVANIEKCWRCHRPCAPELYLKIRGRDQPICQKCVDEMPEEELNGIFEHSSPTPAANVNVQREARKPLTKTPSKKTVLEDIENFEPLKPHGKQRLVAFRISQRAEGRLKQVARLFNLKPGPYMKAVLYRDLGLWDEVMDLRRKEAKKGSL